MCSTSWQSSVKSSFSCCACRTAFLYSSSEKICGVWVRYSRLRSGVDSIEPSCAETLMVSLARTAAVAAPCSMALCRQRSISSRVAKGRAPSWMATYSTCSESIATPACTDCWRVLPPAASRKGGRWYRSLQPSSVSNSSGFVTTTISPTCSTCPSARIDRASTGTPPITSCCLSIPCIRWAIPPAAITAPTRGFLILGSSFPFR